MTDTNTDIAADLGSEAESFSEEELAALSAPDDTIDEPSEPDPQAEPEPAEPAASAEPEPAKEPAKEQDPNHVDMVPHQALHAERLKAREYKQQLDEQNGYLRQINEKLLAQRESANEPKPPSAEEDPLGFLTWQNQQLSQQVQSIQTATEAERRAQSEQQQFNQQWGAYVQELNESAAQIPDFRDAASHLKSVASEALTNQGLSPQEVATELTRREWGLAQQAYSMGVSPARLIYTIAQEHGYKGKPATPDPDPTAEAAAKLDKINAAQSANLSLSKTGGAGSGEITLKDLAAMSGEALERLADTDPDAFAKITAG